jgi:hypothetical protein
MRQDKSGWSEDDYVAQFIFTVVKENSEDKNGIFFRQNLPLITRQWAAYQAFKYKKARMAPSKRRRVKPEVNLDHNTKDEPLPTGVTPVSRPAAVAGEPGGETVSEELGTGPEGRARRP